MRRAMCVVLAVAAASLVACGGDNGKPDRTIAFLRAVPIAKTSQDAFLDELATAGWKVGDNLKVLDPDPTEIHADPADAAKTVKAWIGDGADLIVALSTVMASSASAAAGEVPVITLANDPVASGLVKQARSPEGNLSGVSFRVPADRTIDIATRIGPDITHVGLLWPTDDPAAKPVRDGLIAAARSLHVTMTDAGFANPDAVAGAVQQLVDAGAQVVILPNASSSVRAYAPIQAATAAAKLPIVANIASCSFALLTLAPDADQIYRQLGRQGARLLGGTKIADVPVEDPGSFHLTLHPSIATQLGIQVPADLQKQADDISG